MPDINKLKAELAQAKKDLKAEVKRTKEYSKCVEAFANCLLDSETIFALIERIVEDYDNGKAVEIPSATMRIALKDISKAWKRNSKAFDLRMAVNAANCNL